VFTVYIEYLLQWSGVIQQQRWKRNLKGGTIMELFPRFLLLIHNACARWISLCI